MSFFCDDCDNCCEFDSAMSLAMHGIPGTEENSHLTQEGWTLLSWVKDASPEENMYISVFALDAPQVKLICHPWGVINFLEWNRSCPRCRQYSVAMMTVMSVVFLMDLRTVMPVMTVLSMMLRWQGVLRMSANDNFFLPYQPMKSSVYLLRRLTA